MIQAYRLSDCYWLSANLSAKITSYFVQSQKVILKSIKVWCIGQLYGLYQLIIIDEEVYMSIKMKFNDKIWFRHIDCLIVTGCQLIFLPKYCPIYDYVSFQE